MNSKEAAVDPVDLEMLTGALGMIKALKLEEDCRYIIFVDHKGIQKAVMEKLAPYLRDNFKIACVFVTVYGKPDEVVKVLEVSP